MQRRHDDERLVATEPERAQQIVSESRDLVARTRDAVAQSRKLLERLRRRGGRSAAPADRGAVVRNRDT
jgi:hypothetical protein